MAVASLAVDKKSHEALSRVIGVVEGYRDRENDFDPDGPSVSDGTIATCTALMRAVQAEFERRELPAVMPDPGLDGDARVHLQWDRPDRGAHAIVPGAQDITVILHAPGERPNRSEIHLAAAVKAIVDLFA